MDKIRRQIQDKLEAEKKYVVTRQKGSEIDYSMGKIRAFEQVLGLLK